MVRQLLVVCNISSSNRRGCFPIPDWHSSCVTVQALRLLMLTATRPGELRGARWAEFDLDAAVWIIPAERMKMRSEHPGCRCRRRRWTCCALWSR